MNRELLNRLIRWPKSYLTRTELAWLISRTPDASDAIIRRAIKAGYLQRLCRGLYLLTSKVRAEKPDAREIAQLIYGPSYISFESALSWHSWIPEGVRVVTSATVKRKKEIVTPIGVFAYERILKPAFSIGVRYVQTDNGSFLMAEGWKALADLIYVRRYNWPDIYHVSEDLRIEPQDFTGSDLNLLKELVDQYPSRRTRNCLKRYYEELSR